MLCRCLAELHAPLTDHLSIFLEYLLDECLHLPNPDRCINSEDLLDLSPDIFPISHLVSDSNQITELRHQIYRLSIFP